MTAKAKIKTEATEIAIEIETGVKIGTEAIVTGIVKIGKGKDLNPARKDDRGLVHVTENAGLDLGRHGSENAGV
jgi:hypothetical protein